MSKTVHVAIREFLATVATKGFIIGVLVAPLTIAIAIIGIGTLMNEKPPKVEGELAIVDPTGEVTAGVRDYLSPEAIGKRWNLIAEKLDEAMDEVPEAMRGFAEAAVSSEEGRRALEAALGEVPMIHVRELPVTADLEAEKGALREGSVQEGGRLALAVIDDNAVERGGGDAGYGRYELFVRGKLDDRIEDEVKSALRDAIVDARIRLRGLDREEIEALTRVGRVRSKTVTEQGERETNEILNALLPAGFMVLLLVSVISTGQQIMTTTIEEKSSRVVELLLSAVSPMQLMTGKIAGQMCVGLVILVLYAGLGIGTLAWFALFGLIDPWLFFYLVIFYAIAYFVMGSLMAAIGAAVNELREAQTLMTPVMITVMIPWLLWMPITRDPNSLFATITSFIPPINTFVMLLRMTSSTPPPLWQVWLSIAIGAASVYAALWFAAKVFRVGLLMFGKPPNFATLVRWVRAA